MRLWVRTGVRKANFYCLVCSLSLGFSRVVEEAPDTSKWNEVLSQRQENNPSSPVDLFPGLFVRVAGDKQHTKTTRQRQTGKPVRCCCVFVFV